jgi:hypothetical protein
MKKFIAVCWVSLLVGLIAATVIDPSMAFGNGVSIIVVTILGTWFHFLAEEKEKERGASH